VSGTVGVEHNPLLPLPPVFPGSRAGRVVQGPCVGADVDADVGGADVAACCPRWPHPMGYGERVARRPCKAPPLGLHVSDDQAG